MFGHKARRIQELEERLHELADPKILEAHLEDGTIDLRLESPIARIIAAFFWAMLEGKTTGKYAPNCVQVRVSDPNGRAIEITARRAGGKMPNEIAAEALAERDKLRARFTAPIICLCGSTKFKEVWLAEKRRLTAEGYIVLDVGFFGHADGETMTPEFKAKMDELHKRKIDLADSIFVLNVDGYIGESTRSEIEYAVAHGKPVQYLSDEMKRRAG